jgi:hypothetical protein
MRALLWLAAICGFVLSAIIFPVANPAQAQSEAPPVQTSSPSATHKGVQGDREIDLDIWHKSIGLITVDALLVGSQIYVQPIDVFNFIKVRADRSEDGTILSGYYIEETRKYLINDSTRRITFRDTTWNLTKEDYVIRSTGSFLRADLFETIFHLKCIFEFRSMALELQSGEPLPAETEAAFQKNRKNVGGAHKEIIPDRVYNLSRSWLSIGALDWSGSGNITLANYASGVRVNAIRSGSYSLMLGAQLFGGDFDISQSGGNASSYAQQGNPWRWRLGIQNSDLISQLTIGRHSAFSNLNLPDSMIGFSITNAQQSYTSSFTTYTISDHTEPDWTVELYINDALINYTKADQTGYYKFSVPLSYGTTNMVLKFYGPYGEVRSNAIHLNIPYTFLPPGHLEYTLTGGTSAANPGVRRSLAQLDMKLGVSTAMTLNGGLRYQRDNRGGLILDPYGITSIRVTSGILLGGQYHHNSGYKGTLSLSGPLGISLEGEYDHPLHVAPSVPDSAQIANTYADPFSILELRRLSINAPVPFLGWPIRFTGTDVPLNTDSSNVGMTIGTILNFFGTSFNIDANMNFLRDKFRFTSLSDIRGTIGASLSLFSGFLLRPQLNVDYSTHSISNLQLSFAKQLGEWGALNLGGSHDFVGGGNSVQLELRSTLPFAMLGFTSGTSTGQPINSSATMSGSIGFDPNFLDVYGGSRPEVRRGGLIVVPFIDANSNGVWDAGEQVVQRFGLEQAPGKVIAEPSGILRVTDLEPYRHYVVKTSTNDLENISLMPKFQTFEFTPPANGFTRIDIPLAAGGQIEGYITLKAMNKKDESLGGVRLKVRHWEVGEVRDTSEYPLTEETLSYSNGEFYYMGIPPGHYRIYVDPNQLRLLNYVSVPPYVEFDVKNSEDGDVVNGLNMTLHHDFREGPSSANAK